MLMLAGSEKSTTAIIAADRQTRIFASRIEGAESNVCNCLKMNSA